MVGVGLKSYCKTRWTTSGKSVNSVIRLKPIFQYVSDMKDKQFNFQTYHFILLSSSKTMKESSEVNIHFGCTIEILV